MTLGTDIFVDTGAWVALADADDAHHRKAAAVYPSLLSSSRKLITTNLIIAETYILILKELGHTAAVTFLENIKSSPRIERVHSSAAIETEAEELLVKYRDQDFSYTDAVSFIIMKKYRAKKAFTFDRHFIAAGFMTVP